jgi:hypothetical protein
MTSYYRITNRTSGLSLGLYWGETPDDAVEAMELAAGYRSSRDAAEALGETAESLRADLIVEPVAEGDGEDEDEGEDEGEADEADEHAIRWIAERMVAADRTSGDCAPEVLDDPSAGDGSGWDYAAIEEVAERIGAAHLVRYGVRRDEVLRAYAAAWREAVEAVR